MTEMHTVLAAEVGAHIHYLMEKNGYSVIRLQEEMGLESTQAIYKWLRGKCFPSIDNFVVMSELFGTSVESMLRCERNVSESGICHEKKSFGVNAQETGARIERIMGEKGWSVKALKAAMGFQNPQSIYKWLSGRSLPTINNMLALGNVLEITVDDMLVKAA